MPFDEPAPLLLSTLVGITLALAVWGFWQARQDTAGVSLIDARHDVLLWMLILGAFALGAFLTFILFAVSF